MVDRERVEEIKQEAKGSSLQALWYCAEVAVLRDDLDAITAFWELGINFSDSTFSKFSPMLYACSDNHYDVVRLLLELGFDAASSSPELRPYTTIAAQVGHWNITWLLLEHGADINAIDHLWGTTLLKLAIDSCDQDLIEQLLESGANPMTNGKLLSPYWHRNDEWRMSHFDKYYKDDDYYELIECMPGDHYLDDIHRMLLGYITPEQKDSLGYTAMHMLVLGGCINGIDYLITRGWSLDLVTDHGDSLLHTASETHDELLPYLLLGGADPRLKNRYGETAWQYITLHYDPSSLNRCRQFFSDAEYDPTGEHPFPIDEPKNAIDLHQWKDPIASDGSTMLHHAIFRNNSSLVSRLLHAGFDPYLPTHRGVTPLRMAYRVGASLELIQQLLQAGALPEMPTWECKHFAGKKINPRLDQLLKILSDHGVDFNYIDKEGCTALHYAQNVKMAELLREYRCNPNLHGPTANPPVFKHVISSNWDVVRYLTQNGVHATVTDNEGRNMLHYDDKFNPDHAQYLLDNRVNINAQDNRGMTPLMYAGLFCDIKCVKWFMRHGANPDVQDHSGRTANSWSVYVIAMMDVSACLAGYEVPDEDEE